MTLRTGDELLTEPHIFENDDFKTDNPLVEEIISA